MKTRTFKSVLAILLICALALSMTGCDELDYRKAIKLYNAGMYEAAAEVFYALGDYENCQDLYTDCQYWIAANLAQEGNFQEALPRFLKLGNYENSAQWATECNYQIALTAFGEARFSEAETILQQIPDYKQAKEYLRQIKWQAFYDEICMVQPAISLQQDDKFFSVFPVQDDPSMPMLVLSVEMSESEDHLYSDFLTITLTRESTVADFSCGSDFQMDYVDGTIGSSQSGSGKLDITTCTPQTVLVMDAFEKTVTDNKGNTSTSQDPADSLMGDQMAENLNGLLTAIPELLAEHGITLTLNDIGFAAL